MLIQFDIKKRVFIEWNSKNQFSFSCANTQMGWKKILSGQRFDFDQLFMGMEKINTLNWIKTNIHQYPKIHVRYTPLVVLLSDLWGYHLFLENSSETVKNCLKELIHGETSWTVTNVDRMWRKFKPMKLSQLSYIFLKSTIKNLD